jgi:protein subunit release factor A
MIPLFTSLGVALLVAGQSPMPAQDSASSSAALVQEVRALRQAVEEVLATSVRVQLLMGRLQLQEARIQALIRQNAEIDSEISSMSAERQAIQSQVRAMEGVPNESTDPQERAFAKQQLSALAERMKTLESRHASLLADQANVQQLVVTEQGRWGDFNQRLEELERMLAAPRR